MCDNKRTPLEKAKQDLKESKEKLSKTERRAHKTLCDFIASYIDTKVRVTSADGVNN